MRKVILGFGLALLSASALADDADARKALFCDQAGDASVAVRDAMVMGILPESVVVEYMQSYASSESERIIFGHVGKLTIANKDLPADELKAKVVSDCLS